MVDRHGVSGVLRYGLVFESKKSNGSSVSFTVAVAAVYSFRASLIETTNEHNRSLLEELGGILQKTCVVNQGRYTKVKG